MRGGMLLASGLALEEIDYLGLVRHAVPPVEGRRVGGAHDLLNALEGPALLVLLAIPLAVALVVAVLALVRTGLGGLRGLVLSPIGASLAGAAAFMALAQAVDISDTHVAPVVPGGRVGVLEEPAELLAIVCLSWALALWASHHVAVSPRDPVPPDPRAT